MHDIIGVVDDFVKLELQIRLWLFVDGMNGVADCFANIFLQAVNHKVYYFIVVRLLFYITANLSKSIINYGDKHVDEDKHY